MSLWKILAGATVALAVTGPAMADNHAIRLGTEGAYAPFNFLNDQGEIDGFERELGDALCQRAALDCTWVTNDWDSMIPNLVSGNYDAILAGMSITPERDAVIDFTQDYYPPDPSRFVVLAGAGDPGSVIAAQTATIQAGWVASQDGLTVVEFATPDEAVAAVRNGEADSVLADAAFLADIVKASDGALAFVGDDVTIGDGGVGMGLRESDGDLKARMDAAITAMKQDGTLDAMIAKWFDGRQAGYQAASQP